MVERGRRGGGKKGKGVHRSTRSNSEKRVQGNQEKHFPNSGFPKKEPKEKKSVEIEQRD